jgi:hypothetical protein
MMDVVRWLGDPANKNVFGFVTLALLIGVIMTGGLSARRSHSTDQRGGGKPTIVFGLAFVGMLALYAFGIIAPPW